MEEAFLSFFAWKHQDIAKLRPQRITVTSPEVGQPPLLAESSISANLLFSFCIIDSHVYTFPQCFLLPFHLLSEQ